MGQQQLLLLVLGIVIVGLAVVVGIQAFGENQKKSQIDQFTGMGVGMSGEVIAWYQNPTAQGGGGGNAARLGVVKVSDLGYPQDFSDTWAGYTRTGFQSNGVRRDLMMSTTHPAWHITVYPQTSGSTRVEVHAFGPYPECIVSRNGNLTGAGGWSDGKGETDPPDNPNATKCTW